MRDKHDATNYDLSCFLMRSLLSRLSDGTLTGLGRWFAERHVADCPRCSEALGTLVVIQARLRALGLPKQEEAEALKLRPATRIRLTEQMDEIDRALSSPGQKFQ